MITADDDKRLDGFCSCGREMDLSGGGYTCANCDFPQPQEMRCSDCDKPGECEHPPGRRIATDRDYAFTKVWRQRMLRLFPGQSIR